MKTRQRIEAPGEKVPVDWILPRRDVRSVDSKTQHVPQHQQAENLLQQLCFLLE